MGITGYYPLEVGNTWDYATKKHTKISRLFDVKETDKHGTVEQRVLRASRLSTEGLKVFAVRHVVEERGFSGLRGCGACGPEGLRGLRGCGAAGLRMDWRTFALDV